ncbi:MAG: hypothetical protein NXY57DRAFT_1048454 [Lentinula lateritia]|nr:MAG: hypothetical protein NXY57DRAFT_1048454 [Lentinula lateritia]
MRESNFAFPAQNKACVCITSQLYDRRALDTTSPLPLFNSLTHLTYLTSTSPRIREIMTMDGGLERLVRLLHEFCLCPPPPENPSLFYGLAPPSARPPKPLPTLNPTSFDKHAAYRFSLAFQCVVNIGVRGSEPIRSRVVQAGTLEVVGCILEAWLAHKGFAIGPNASGTPGSATGWGSYGRESREQRHARRQQQRQMLRDVEEAADLARALQRQMSHSENPVHTTGTVASITEVYQDSPNEASATTSLIRTGTSASGIEISGTDDDEGPVVIPPGRDRSGTVVARANWDPIGQQWRNVAASLDTAQSSPTPSVSSNDQSRPSSRPQSETEDDADVDMDGPIPNSASTNASISDIDAPSPRIGHGDAHIIINDSAGGADGLGTMGDVGMNMGLGGGMAGEDGIVSLEIENNDDFAMGAPPGAPGAIPAANMGDVTLGLDGDLSMSETEDGSRPASRGEHVVPEGQVNLEMERSGTIRRVRAPGTPDATPRAGVIGLPPSPSAASSADRQNTLTVEGSRRIRSTASNISIASTAATASTTTTTHTLPPSPYRDEDVLLSLQLLAYLSKYPHVRQAFYKKRDSFHPASAGPIGGPTPAIPSTSTTNSTPGPSRSGKEKEPNKLLKESSVFFRAFTSAATRGKEKERVNDKYPTASSSSSPTAASPTPRQTNVFSLVERFTYRPSSSELAEYSSNGSQMNVPPRLPPEIQYWAGVIMRNACRKDDSRGGIRQCANMLCGRWEEYPREFAKCRRCRKAKYCGKECQSTAWSEGHRFWCSAKDADDETTAAPASASTVNAGEPSQTPQHQHAANAGEPDRRERRDRERDRHGRDRVVGAHRPRGLEALGRQANDAPISPTATISRAAEAIDRGFTLFNLQRPSPGQVVPSQSRARPELASYGSSDGSEFDASEGGRRRSETVTGVMSVGSSTGRPDLTIPPYVPNSTQRSHGTRGQQEPSTSRLHRLLPTRNDSAGQTTRSGNEEHNMLLG